MSEKIIHIDSVVFSHFEYTKECDRSILAIVVSYLLSSPSNLHLPTEAEEYLLNGREIAIFDYNM